MKTPTPHQASSLDDFKISILSALPVGRSFTKFGDCTVLLECDDVQIKRDHPKDVLEMPVGSSSCLIQTIPPDTKTFLLRCSENEDIGCFFLFRVTCHPKWVKQPTSNSFQALSAVLDLINAQIQLINVNSIRNVSDPEDSLKSN